MPDGRAVRRGAATHRDGQGQQGPPARAPALIRLRRRPRACSVAFVTRAGCSMCAEAQPVVERVCARAGVPLTVLDVDADPALAEHSDHVPVVVVDGTVVARWWVDEQELTRALR